MSVPERTGQKIAIRVTSLNATVVEKAGKTRTLDGEEAVETVQVKLGTRTVLAMVTCALHCNRERNKTNDNDDHDDHDEEKRRRRKHKYSFSSLFPFRGCKVDELIRSRRYFLTGSQYLAQLIIHFSFSVIIDIAGLCCSPACTHIAE